MSSLLFLLLFPFLVLLLTPAWTLEFRYHNNREIEDYLRQVNASNPDITHLYSIGQSVRGQQLWVLCLGTSPRRHTVGIPEFKYVANMHGNEVLSRVLLLHLVDDLLRSYRSNEAWSVQLLNSVRIHILPTMNPDGFDASDTNCVLSQGRFNHNGIDLNRNFPDAFTGVRKQQQNNEEKREPEVRAVMAWTRSESFVLSANLHGGAMVASYPYDNSNGGSELVGGASISPDNDVFIELAKVYSQNHASMHRGNSCADTRPFLNGITNGYQWYAVPGGMQDYNYVWGRCLELTLEVSCCKYPPASELPALWADNREALLAFMLQVHLGVKGRVFDDLGVPMQDAVVEVEGRKNMFPFKTNEHGEYYRLLLPGSYRFTVTLPGHKVLTETLDVPYGPDNHSAMKHDFTIQRIVTTTSRPAANTTLNATLQAEGGGAIGLAWSRLAVGLSLVVALQSLPN